MDDNFIENVYLSLQGLLVEEARMKNVENLFAPGSDCEKLYSDVLAAYARLCSRLGTKEEDDDVEIIINSLTAICDRLCLNMYRYGARFGMTG